MPLSAGARLGIYVVGEPLGAGGMGVVYRARDSKLGRDVALKLLPDRTAADAERVARFEREARALAALHHPHIATLFGMEEFDGRHFLVMELVEGETLAERLARTAIPVNEVLRLAREIADALEAAHDKGIVHRDLKPANIKITVDEHAKVLDFGLAKDVAAKESDSTVLGTEEGVILGTAAYMSPEQARGKAVDRRTDIWAFGCVLYEMLCGKRAFPAGESLSDSIAADIDRRGRLGRPAGRYASARPDIAAPLSSEGSSKASAAHQRGAVRDRRCGCRRDGDDRFAAPKRTRRLDAGRAPRPRRLSRAGRMDFQAGTCRRAHAVFDQPARGPRVYEHRPAGDRRLARRIAHRVCREPPVVRPRRGG